MLSRQHGADSVLELVVVCLSEVDDDFRTLHVWLKSGEDLKSFACLVPGPKLLVYILSDGIV